MIGYFGRNVIKNPTHVVTVSHNVFANSFHCLTFCCETGGTDDHVLECSPITISIVQHYALETNECIAPDITVYVPFQAGALKQKMSCLLRWLPASTISRIILLNLFV